MRAGTAASSAHAHRLPCPSKTAKIERSRDGRSMNHASWFSLPMPPSPPSCVNPTAGWAGRCACAAASVRATAAVVRLSEAKLRRSRPLSRWPHPPASAEPAPPAPPAVSSSTEVSGPSTRAKKACEAGRRRRGGGTRRGGLSSASGAALSTTRATPLDVKAAQACSPPRSPLMILGRSAAGASGMVRIGGASPAAAAGPTPASEGPRERAEQDEEGASPSTPTASPAADAPAGALRAVRPHERDRRMWTSPRVPVAPCGPAGGCVEPRERSERWWKAEEEEEAAEEAEEVEEVVAAEEEKAEETEEEEEEKPFSFVGSPCGVADGLDRPLRLKESVLLAVDFGLEGSVGGVREGGSGAGSAERRREKERVRRMAAGERGDPGWVGVGGVRGGGGGSGFVVGERGGDSGGGGGGGGGKGRGAGRRERARERE